MLPYFGSQSAFCKPPQDDKSLGSIVTAASISLSSGHKERSLVGSGSFGAFLDAGAQHFPVPGQSHQFLQFTDFKIRYHEDRIEGVSSALPNRPIDLPNDIDAVKRAVLGGLD